MNRFSLNFTTQFFFNFWLIQCLWAVALSPTWADIKDAGTADKTATQITAITEAQIKAKIDSLSTGKGADQPEQIQLLEIYQTALDNIINTNTYNAKITAYEKAAKTLPDKTLKNKVEIEQLEKKLTRNTWEDFSNIPRQELEQRLILEKDKLAELITQITNLETDIAQQNDRSQKIREELTTAQQALDQIENNALPAQEASITAKSEARQMKRRTQLDALNAEVKMLTAEQSSYQPRYENLKSNLALLNLQRKLLTPVVTAIENLVYEKKQNEAANLENELSKAEKSASGKHNLIQSITRENIQLSRDLQEINTKVQKYNDKINQITATTNAIESDYKSAEKKISLAGLSPVLGKILREQRRNLANTDKIKLQSNKAQEETAITSLDQLKLEEKQKSLTDIDGYLTSLMSQRVEQSLPSEERMMIQAELRVLLNNQKDIINKLLDTDSTYLRTLGDFDFANQQLLVVATKFSAYLDEHLLWVPSSTPINAFFIPGLIDASQWFLSPDNWSSVGKNVVNIASNNILITIFASLLAFFLPYIRSWAKSNLLTISEKVGKIYTDDFLFTAQALGFTILLILPIPITLYFLGWFLCQISYANEFSNAIGYGLKSIAVPFLILQFFYRFFSTYGIAAKHFHWLPANAALLRKQVAWIRFIIIPGVFIISVTSNFNVVNYADTLGRLALIANMIALMAFLMRILHPSKGLLHGYIASNPEDWLVKLRYIWYPALCFVPLILVGFASAGFYLSALELQQKLILTLRLVFFTVIVYELALRWLTLTNRKLAIKNLQLKRKAALSQTEKPTPSEGVEGDDPTLPVEEQLIDIPTINDQTIKLLRVFIFFTLLIGFWITWQNILPAFAFLERIVLWQHLVKVEGQESYQPVTLTNLLMSGLYIFIAIKSVKNISGAMELFIFSRMSIAAGVRYAVNQLTKYLIVSIAFICIANELGGSWSQVQWLVAALSVGLGFGLQEIFANLVSGIILLFERPIRVGDTVTIDNMTGKVSRIQMRATTIIDWDQKELIVPNKTFITNQLTNWSLSDAITRIVVPIGIAYGSDIELAHKVLMDAVRSTPLVLEDPAPSVVFNGFGDSSLNFSIRAFVSEIANRLPVTHNLHVNLEKMLREHQIEIPFPQRDIHIRSVTKEDNGQ